MNLYVAGIGVDCQYFCIPADYNITAVRTDTQYFCAFGNLNPAGIGIKFDRDFVSVDADSAPERASVCPGIIIKPVPFHDWFRPA